MCFVRFLCKVYGPYSYAEPTVTGTNYLDMLQLWLMPQLQEDSQDFIFQQDRAQPNFHFDVRAHLNVNLPGRWIGRDSHNDSLLPWPSRSPDLTSCDFFLWGSIKDRVYMPLCHVIYHSCDKGPWMQSLLSTARCCNVCGRNSTMQAGLVTNRFCPA